MDNEKPMKPPTKAELYAQIEQLKAELASLKEAKSKEVEVKIEVGPPKNVPTTKINLKKMYLIAGHRYGPGRNVEIPQALVQELTHMEYLIERNERALHEDRGKILNLGTI